MGPNPFESQAPVRGGSFNARNIDHERLYVAWFKIVDPDNDGRVQGKDAVGFFGRSGLPRDQLAKVWTFADQGRRGFLDFKGFTKAMELIAVGQKGVDVSPEAHASWMASGRLGPPTLMGIQELMAKLQIRVDPPAEEASTNPFGSSASGMGSSELSSSGARLRGSSSATSLSRKNSGADEGGYASMYDVDPYDAHGANGAMALGPPTSNSSSLSVLPPRAPSLPSSPQPWTGAPSPINAPSVQKSPYMYAPGQSKSAFKNRTYSKTLSTKECVSIIDGLKRIYFQKIRPLEDAFKFGNFFSALLNEGDFDAKPSVLLLGQYSTGKTTFIKHLLKRDYPGINIGPEPTTDRFVVVESGLEERRTPGNTLIVQPDKPYQALSQYGNGFLAKFESACCPNSLLDEITLVDTPGVLSGEKQRIERTYNFIDVCGWFATRCDLILLLFDPHKLDISDEFKQVISTLRGHDDKVRVVLNKADQVDQQQLMRVYGALMWSLGKVFKSPEVCKVYIGSFNADKPIREDVNPYCRDLFEREQNDLLQDLFDIPQRSCDRKVNEFVKRVRAARIHILIMGHLRKQMPVMMGKNKAQEKMLANLNREFAAVQREHHLPPGDFPDVTKYREILSAYDISVFPKLKDSMLRALDEALTVDIPNLMRQFENPYG
ncbi:hypothetical protein WJX74_009623 [Apatococcus lobatus]|uniref:Uncharacterized protein n=1 Tax=Apatococcus lobatus TaxID=904363 RepID=A0AAW1QHZ3_9CHLO